MTGLDENANDDSAADTGAAFGEDDGEFNLFTTDRQLGRAADRRQDAGHAQREEGRWSTSPAACG